MRKIVYPEISYIAIFGTTKYNPGIPEMRAYFSTKNQNYGYADR